MLRPGGRFVTATLADENMSDLWDPRFAAGAEPLVLDDEQRRAARAAFRARRGREAEGVIAFRTPKDMRQFVAANMVRAHMAAKIPEFTEPVPIRTHHTIFVAEKAA